MRNMDNEAGANFKEKIAKVRNIKDKNVNILLACINATS